MVYMQRCLQLAANGMGHTRTNPMVGCVVVHNHKIIAEGYHRYYGGPHAEVEALSQVEDETVLRACTVYVSLEPCAHTGKTPPCADLLVHKGIQKVIIASPDPNPLVAGKGMQKLKDAGIQVETGILDAENRALNKRFFTFHEKKRPYIVLKWAQSTDGWIAPENHTGQYRLTGNLANIQVHAWRAQEMGIMVGARTVVQDNPRLTVRLTEGQNPVRLVMGNPFAQKQDYYLLDGEAPTIVFNTAEEKTNGNITYVKITAGDFVQQAMDYLYTQNINSVMVEGGLHTLQAFIKAGLWDEARIFQCDAMLHKGIPAPYITGEKTARTKIGHDVLTILQNTGVV